MVQKQGRQICLFYRLDTRGIAPLLHPRSLGGWERRGMIGVSDLGVFRDRMLLTSLQKRRAIHVSRTCITIAIRPTIVGKERLHEIHITGNPADCLIRSKQPQHHADHEKRL